MSLLRNSVKLLFFIVTLVIVNLIPSSAETLSTMVDSVLESHEDIINSKKELEEASRDVTDALLVLSLIHI